MSRIAKLLIYPIPAILFLCGWEWYVHGVQRLEFLFASPRLIAAVAVMEVSEGMIWTHIGITLSEALLGLVIGSILGTATGLLLWINERVAKLARPYIVLLGSIPIFAIAPMLIIWFGTGLLSKVVMAAFAVFFVALAQAYDGARSCAYEHTQYARTLNAPRWQVVRKIILPGALRWVSAGVKLNIGLAFIGAFIGEFVSSQAGLGHYILGAGSLYDMPRVIFGVLLISLLALGITGAVWIAENRRPHLFAR